MAGINDLFSRFGPPAKTKLLLLGSPDFRSENLMNQVRSLNLEHVSPATLMRSEISRRPGPAGSDEATTLARLRLNAIPRYLLAALFGGVLALLASVWRAGGAT